jgi:propionyl-CoA synthetase
MADTAIAETSGYHSTYQAWKSDPEGFWAEAASAIDWDKPWDRVFDPDQGVYGRWFAGAKCNTCHNAVDRHVAAGRGDNAAIIYDSPITGKKRTITYAELLKEVTALAATIADLGVGHGDRVLIYMPMVPEAVIAMLASARLGAVHSVVFGGFAANELATRIDDCKPKAIISASCGLEPSRVVAYKPLLDAAIDLSNAKPGHCVILQREENPCDLIEGRDIDMRHAMDAHIAAGTGVPCASVEATDPLYILYTSGTTGQPKGVVRDNGGHMVALNWSMSNVYDIAPGEVFWAASDVGWVVGHSYIVYAPLLTARRRSCSRASPSARPTPVPSGA